MAADTVDDSLERYKTSLLLRDGSTVIVRPIRPEDEERHLAFVKNLSTRSIYLRFHHVLSQLSREETRRFCTVDYICENVLKFAYCHSTILCELINYDKYNYPSKHPYQKLSIL